MLFTYLDAMDGRGFQDHIPFIIPVLTSEPSIEMLCSVTWLFCRLSNLEEILLDFFSVLISVIRCYLHVVYCSTLWSRYYNVPVRLSEE